MEGQASCAPGHRCRGAVSRLPICPNFRSARRGRRDRPWLSRRSLVFRGWMHLTYIRDLDRGFRRLRTGGLRRSRLRDASAPNNQLDDNSSCIKARLRPGPAPVSRPAPSETDQLLWRAEAIFPGKSPSRGVTLVRHKRLFLLRKLVSLLVRKPQSVSRFNSPFRNNSGDVRPMILGGCHQLLEIGASVRTAGLQQGRRAQSWGGES